MNALPPVTLLETRLFPLEKCAYFDDFLTPFASLLTPSLCDHVYNYRQKVVIILADIDKWKMRQLNRQKKWMGGMRSPID